MTTTETAPLTVTQLVDFLEDRLDAAGVKDTLYSLVSVDEDDTVMIEHIDNDNEFWVITRDGDTFTAREADERDY